MSYTPLSLQVSGLARAELNPDCTCLDRCDCSFLAHVHNTNVRLAHSYRFCECERVRCQHYYEEYMFREQDIEQADAIYAIVNPPVETVRAAFVEQNELYLAQAEERYQAAQRIAADLARIEAEEDAREGVARGGKVWTDYASRNMTASPSVLSSPRIRRRQYPSSPDSPTTPMSDSPSFSSSSVFSPMSESSSPRTPMSITMDGYFSTSSTPLPSRQAGRQTPKAMTRPATSNVRTTPPHPAFMIAPVNTSQPITQSTQPYALPTSQQPSTRPYSSTTNIIYMPGPSASIPMERSRASLGRKRTTKSTEANLLLYPGSCRVPSQRELER